eukprot:TRINITY_DN10316_c0_g1_i4.p1 TRINITY_DN10316_c0_g1~~TRINITY_DN10316_c0_g1_i4.p1  ORF type:complete len:300 (-),score=87.20 TRINITY_DN10316_c0_g1_i4:105-1004(-)
MPPPARSIKPPLANTGRNQGKPANQYNIDDNDGFEQSNFVPSNRRQPMSIQSPSAKEEKYTPSVMKGQQKRQVEVEQSTTSISSKIDERPAVASRKPVLPPVDPNADEEDLELIECPEGCGRRFNEKALEKHVKVCQKVFQTKRQAFDVAGMRKTDEQAELESKSKRPGKRGAQSKQAPSAKTDEEAAIAGANKKAKWKLQSEAFRAGLRAGRGGEISQADQKVLAAAAEDTLVHCNHCGRKFNEKAAEKHIPFCANKSRMDKIKAGPAPSNLGGNSSRNVSTPTNFNGGGRIPAKGRR